MRAQWWNLRSSAVSFSEFASVRPRVRHFQACAEASAWRSYCAHHGSYFHHPSPCSFGLLAVAFASPCRGMRRQRTANSMRRNLVAILPWPDAQHHRKSPENVWIPDQALHPPCEFRARTTSYPHCVRAHSDWSYFWESCGDLTKCALCHRLAICAKWCRSTSRSVFQKRFTGAKPGGNLLKIDNVLLMPGLCCGENKADPGGL
jgi:hypothetical protein